MFSRDIEEDPVIQNDSLETSVPNNTDCVQSKVLMIPETTGRNQGDPSPRTVHTTLRT